VFLVNKDVYLRSKALSVIRGGTLALLAFQSPTSFRSLQTSEVNCTVADLFSLLWAKTWLFGRRRNISTRTTLRPPALSCSAWLGLTRTRCESARERRSAAWRKWTERLPSKWALSAAAMAAAAIRTSAAVDTAADCWVQGRSNQVRRAVLEKLVRRGEWSLEACCRRAAKRYDRSGRARVLLFVCSVKTAGYLFTDNAQYVLVTKWYN